MVNLPTYQPRGAVTRAPQSSLSAAEIANPFQQIADALGNAGKAFEAKEMEDASNDGQNAVYRGADGSLQVDLKSNFTATGRSYNRAAQQGYAARLAGDIRARGSALADDSKGNIDTFNSSWKAFRDQTLSAVPKDFRGAATTMLDTEGPRFALGVSERKRTADLKEFEGNIKSEIQLLDDDMSALARSGGTGTDAYRQKQSQLKTLWSELAQNPDFTVGDKEADISMRRMESRHMSEAMLGTVEKSLSTGGLAAARDVANRILTDETLSLTPSERRQYAGLASERISSYTAQRKADLKPVQDQSKVIQERLKTGVGLDNDDIDIVARQLSSGGDMAGALDLYNARAVAKTLNSFGLADNRLQMNMTEAAFSRANGGDVLLAAIQGVESDGNPNAVSSKGAAGLMQVMTETADGIARELGDPAYPSNGTREQKQDYLKNVDVSQKYGSHYFNQMMARYGGDREAALIAYNAGPKRADAWLSAGRDDSAIPKESADYYKKVLNRAGSSRPASPEEITVARTFLQGRTDKDASHIDGLQDGFAVKLSRLIQSAPPEMRDKLGVYSGARSVERQAELWQEALKKYGSAEEARKWVAPPGNSEHNHGNAADLSFGGASLANAPDDVAKWLHDNAGQYGLKFPLGNENWHIEDDGTRGGKSSMAVAPEVIKEYQAEATRDAKDLFGDIKAGYDKGFTPAITDINLLTRQLAVVDDQDFKREVADYFTSQSAITAVQNMAPGDVESLMSQLRADTSDGATAAQQQIMTGMQAAQEARTKALADDPIGYAVNRGLVPAPPALDLSQPDTWGNTFQSLQRGVDVLQTRGEVGNISALRPEMLGQVSNMLETATPQQSMQLLSSMAASMRPETYKATLGKLYASGQGRAAATAGALAPHNPAAAEGILRGQLLLKENPLLAPKKTDDNRADIDTMLPLGAFSSGSEASRQFLLESATARYADLSQQSGDTSGDLNSDRMQQAITEVTGGVLDMNGYPVIAPTYGMTQDDFDKRLSGLTDADLAGAVTTSGQPVRARDLISQGRIRAVADGRYVLEFGPEASPTYVMRQPSPGNYRGPSTFVLDLGSR